jgi:hypothetical protein
MSKVAGRLPNHAGTAADTETIWMAVKQTSATAQNKNRMIIVHNETSLVDPHKFNVATL